MPNAMKAPVATYTEHFNLQASHFTLHIHDRLVSEQGDILSDFQSNEEASRKLITKTDLRIGLERTILTVS